MNGPVQERAEGPEQLRQGERERGGEAGGEDGADDREGGARGRERGGDAVEKEKGWEREKGARGDRQERIERSQVG